MLGVASEGIIIPGSSVLWHASCCVAFCVLYTLIFLPRLILLCRPNLEVMCDVAFQSSLLEYEHLLHK